MIRIMVTFDRMMEEWAARAISTLDGIGVGIDCGNASLAEIRGVREDANFDVVLCQNSAESPYVLAAKAFTCTD